jgi:hypothetical protein
MGVPMRRLGQILVLAAALAAPALVLLPSPEAGAAVAFESRYTFEQTFGTALRLLRVDLGCKITEKDGDNGYVLFDYTSGESGKQVHHGSLEVVRTQKGAHVAVQLATLPRYHEQMIVDALVRKLLAEHGEPPPARDKAPPPPPPPDTDGGSPDAER